MSFLLMPLGVISDSHYVIDVVALNNYCLAGLRPAAHRYPRIVRSPLQDGVSGIDKNVQ
jgi:hypothetical protein